MKAYQKQGGTIWAFEEDGSQDHLITGDMTPYECPIINTSKNKKESEIKTRLSIIDTQESIRPIRAIYAGTDTPEDHEKLAALENESMTLREELERLQ